MKLTLNEVGIFNNGIPIVEYWEKDIQKRLAKEVCSNIQGSKKIIEIGYGLGLCANEVTKYKPEKHIIVEFIEEIAKNAIKECRNAKIYTMDWKEFIKKTTEKFNGIIFDAYPINQELSDLLEVEKQVVLDALPILFEILEDGGFLGFLDYDGRLLNTIFKKVQKFSQAYEIEISLPKEAKISFPNSTNAKIIVLIK